MQNKFGIDTQTLTPAEAKEYHPLLQYGDVDVIGYESRTGYCDPYLTTTSYAKRAKDLGVQFFTETLVTGIQCKGNIKTVKTQKGSFETENIKDNVNEIKADLRSNHTELRTDVRWILGIGITILLGVVTMVIKVFGLR